MELWNHGHYSCGLFIMEVLSSSPPMSHLRNKAWRVAFYFFPLLRFSFSAGMLKYAGYGRSHWERGNYIMNLRFLVPFDGVYYGMAGFMQLGLGLGWSGMDWGFNSK